MKRFLGDEAKKKLVKSVLNTGQGNSKIMCNDDAENLPDFINIDLLEITPQMMNEKTFKCSKPKITGISKSSEVQAKAEGPLCSKVNNVSRRWSGRNWSAPYKFELR